MARIVKTKNTPDWIVESSSFPLNPNFTLILIRTFTRMLTLNDRTVLTTPWTEDQAKLSLACKRAKQLLDEVSLVLSYIHSVRFPALPHLGPFNVAVKGNRAMFWPSQRRRQVGRVWLGANPPSSASSFRSRAWLGIFQAPFPSYDFLTRVNFITQFKCDDSAERLKPEAARSIRQSNVGGYEMK